MTSQEAIAELSEEKRQLLAVSDVAWVWTHNAWGHRQRRKILAHEWIKSRTLKEIREALAGGSPSGEWKHYFTQPPSAVVLARIIAELD